MSVAQMTVKHSHYNKREENGPRLSLVKMPIASMHVSISSMRKKGYCYRSNFRIFQERFKFISHLSQKSLVMICTFLI